ncbi:MAG: translation initiation factor IF-2 [Clostridia bacterium]|nr:translation initiation factor IF-2 [Clostridia bacterium]
MATKTNSMFRISQLAKDLGIKPKDLVAKLEGIGISVKSTSATLEEGDVNALFASMTDGARIHDLDGYLHGKTSITLPESPEEKSKREAAEKAEADRIKAEAEAKRKAEEEAKRRAEEEARKKAEEEARRRAEEEARKKAEEEARIRAEEEARRKAEEEARIRAEEEARKKAEEEARIRAEEEARKKAEEEARIRAEEEARRKAEEERIKAEEDARLKAEAEARAKAEAAEKEKTTDRPQRPQNTQRDGANRNQNTNYQQNRTGNGQPQRDNRGPAGANNQRTDRPYGDRNTGDRPAGDRPYHNDRYNQNRPQNGQQGQSRPFGQNNQQRPQRDSVPRDKDSGNDRAPIAPQPKPKIEQGVERKRTGQTRVVDTRTTSVDLSKYDERLDNFSPEIDDKQSNKQKLKKQNQRGDNRGTGRKSDKERFAMDKMQKANLEKAKKQPLKVTIPDEISVGELAQRLKITAAECVKKLMLMGMMATVNQIIDFDTAYLIADELGAEVTREVTVTIEDKLFNEEPDTEENLEIRAPIVCVMGHVDHGKTSILDAIRHTNVTSGEAGGITQHIGAYRVQIDGRDITFLDTPGHEAFTAMRARGAQCTDIAILVVAGDDGIMPQTVEAINHAKAAGVDIIVAINKMDKPTANADAVMTELTKYELVPEEWGGDVMCVPVSAHTGMGITDLLEDVLLIADVKEYKANPHKRAKGVVIEAKLDKGRGPVATVLVQDGTLKAGDIVIAGTSVGRVRAMTNDRGQQLQEAGPSVPVEIIGLSEVPLAGDEFNAVEDERMARELADQRREKAKEEQFKLNAKVSLDDLFSQIAAGVKELNVIVKADVGGSAEAVKASLEKISTEEVRVRVIHSAVGGITESDVTFAAASNAIIVGFNVRPGKGALDAAERQNVDIRTYRIIYECIEEITAAMKGMLAPTYKEVLLGHIEVRQTIKVPGVGIIAGSYVQDGKVTRQSQIRIVRDGIVIMEDKISSLRRFKDDVREVATGYECGIGLEKCMDIQIGDILEAYIMEEVAR